MRLFHTTDSAAAILSGGFRDGEGSYMFVDFILRGVFLGRWPADINDGAKGDQIIEVVFPDDLDLEEYAIVQDGLPPWEWCVPAELINKAATLRLLNDDEVEEVVVQRWEEIDAQESQTS